MRIVLFFLFLIVCGQTQAQGFASGPYQSLDLAGLIVADFNGDGKLDVFGINYFNSPPKMLLRLNTGDSTVAFTSKNPNLSFDVYGRAAAGDLDGDKDLDLVVSKGAARNLFMLKNDGTGGFSLDSLGISGSTYMQIKDVDNDKDLDIIGMRIDLSLRVYINDGSLKFSTITILNNESDLEVFDTGDMDNDGDLDIVAGFRNFSGLQIALYENSGTNSFSSRPIVFDNFSGLSGLLIDDLNGDGKKDIVAIRSFGGSAFINTGNLNFAAKPIPMTNNLPISLATGDYNGDGRKDLIIGYNSEGIVWFKNMSNTTLQYSTQKISTIQPAYEIVNGDLDNDKDTDIVVSNDEFWWLINGITQESVSTITFPEEVISIFPNPFEDVIRIQGASDNLYTVKIYNAGGKQVYHADIASGTLDVSQLNAGLYFLTLTNTATRQAQSVSLFKSK
jgi:FG-GAP-like repeat/Secretion system C-terminal sorting domain